MRQSLVAEPAGHRDLLASGEIARAGNQSRVDRVAHDDVESRFRGRCADARSPTVIEIDLRHTRGPQRVLLDRHLLNVGEARCVVPREMGVRLDHPRHQRGARAINHGAATAGERARAARDSADALAAHEHLAAVRCSAAAVQNLYVGKQNFRVGHLFS